jgi:rhodanese-related sulfurtransferase
MRSPSPPLLFLFSLLALLALSKLGRVSAFAIHHRGALTISKHSTSAAVAARSLFVASLQRGDTRKQSLLTVRAMSNDRKGGVASPEELKDFVQKAGDRLVVVDVRNPDAAAEPGDQKSLTVAALPSDSFRPKAMHLIWDRATASMPLPPSDKVSSLDTPIITHCGGGGRGQLAKEFLESKGYTSVMNGGGPKETECWAEFGDK